MTTLNRRNTFSARLFVLSAGLLLRAHGVFASDPGNDAQAQARAFLDPPVVHRVIAAQGISNSPASDRTLVYQDAQESVRAFLSGTARSTREGRPVAASGRNYRVSGDPQDAMRRTILGLGAAPTVARPDTAARETLSVRRLP